MTAIDLQKLRYNKIHAEFFHTKDTKGAKTTFINLDWPRLTFESHHSRQFSWRIARQRAETRDQDSGGCLRGLIDLDWPRLRSQNSDTVKSTAKAESKKAGIENVGGMPIHGTPDRFCFRVRLRRLKAEQERPPTSRLAIFQRTRLSPAATIPYFCGIFKGVFRADAGRGSGTD